MWGTSDDLRSFDGESWTVRRNRPRDGEISDVEVQRDGTVWAVWKVGSGQGWRVGRLDADGWEVLPGTPEPFGRPDLFVAEDGGPEVWLMGAGFRLQRHDGRGW